MRNGALSTILACLVSASGLALGACGGDDSARREVTWRPDERLPQHAAHWWWEPPERQCEEDEDCRTGETCHNMRLGTCPGCPRGEDAEMCIPREEAAPNTTDADPRRAQTVRVTAPPQ